MDERTRELVDRITKTMADKGMIVEGGWRAYVVMKTQYQTRPVLITKEMRDAYFLGAQHLFASIFKILEPGQEPSDRDMKRLDDIDKELKAFIREYQQRNN
jgi:hypothetical protein